MLRVLEKVALALLFGVAACATAADQTRESEGPFTVTKGAGTAVCDAYLGRLNLERFSKPPYCGRPENSKVEGFQALNRIPLSVTEALALGDRISNFTSHGHQEPARTGQFFITRSLLVRELGRDINAWRYLPKVDIDNDGKPDSVVVWQGYGASKSLYLCGRESNNQPRRQAQIAYIVDAGLTRIDESRTRKIFGHPLGGYPIFKNGKRVGTSREFRPIGRSIGIFEYRHIYYFDTFFDSYGDFQGKRKKDPEIANTLGVFLRRDGITKEICELRWNYPE